MIVSRRVRPVPFLIVLLGLLAVPVLASASKGSISPSSLRTANFGAKSYAADMHLVDDEPCALISNAGKAGRGTVLACGTRLQRRANPGAFAPKHRFLSAFDVVDGSHLTFVGYSTPTAKSTVYSPVLIRTDLNGQPIESWGTQSVASLASLRPEGLRSVSLGGVDAAADGGTIVTGAAQSKQRLRAFVARIDAAGQIDGAFGSNGVTVIDVPGYPRAVATSMRVMDDGRVLVVGWASQTAEGSFVAFAALLDASGTLVPTFGRGGIALPKLGTNSALTALPAAGSATFPIPVSGSSNSKGAIRAWAVQLEESGTLRRSGSKVWGGPRSITTASYVGHKRGLQMLDIERLSDGSVVGAAELMAEGDWDSFVTRFHPATGKPDAGFSNRGLEPIDDRPGSEDDEWTQAIAVGSNDTTWVLGMHSLGKRDVVHLFSTMRTGSSSAARFPATWIGLIGSNGRPMRCGTSAKKACKVAAGTKIEVAYSIKGPRSTSMLTRPWIVHWSKGASKKAKWKNSSAVTQTWMNKSYINGRRFYRVNKGTHEFLVRRNGTKSFGPAWYGSLHVRAR